MLNVITQNVPICPKCKASLLPKHQVYMYFFCIDCMSIYRVVGNGKAENELIVTDKELEDDRENPIYTE